MLKLLTPQKKIEQSLSNVSVYYVVGDRIIHGFLKKLPEKRHKAH